MPDSADALELYSRVLWKPAEIIELRGLPTERGGQPPPRQKWLSAGDLPALADALDRANEEGLNLYAGVLPRLHSGGATDADCAPGHVVWADLDGVAPEAALARAEAAGLPAVTLAVNSGHGVHLFWALEEAAAPADLAALVGDLAALLGSDRSVRNPSRILRLPGFINHKPPAAKAEIISADPDRRYRLAELRLLIPAAPKLAPTPAPAPLVVLGDRADLLKRAAAYAAAIPGASQGERNAAGFRTATKLRSGFELTEAEAWPLLLAWNARNAPPLDERELQAVFKDGALYAKQPAGALAATPRPAAPAVAPAAGGAEPGRQEDGLVLTNLADVEPEAVTWLWPNRLPLGKLSILAGDPGQGKSRLTYDIAARVTTGAIWPDGARGGEPGRVVILSAEDGKADTIRPVLEASGADLAGVELIEAARVNGKLGMFNLAEHVGLLERAIVKLGRVKLLIIDPLSAYLGGVDDNSNSELRTVLMPLCALAEHLRFVFWAVHHLNKAPSLKAIYRVCGSIGYAGAARAIWAVAAEKDNLERRLFLCAKMSLCRRPDGLAYSIGERGEALWEAGPVHVTADEALAPDQRSRRTTPLPDELDDAALLRHLAGKRLPKEAIVLSIQKGLGCGISTARALFGRIVARHHLDQLTAQDGVKDCGPFLAEARGVSSGGFGLILQPKPAGSTGQAGTP